jgi:hypothetical protein
VFSAPNKVLLMPKKKKTTPPEAFLKILHCSAGALFKKYIALMESFFKRFHFSGGVFFKRLHCPDIAS